jgi:hypothetical protein
MELLARPGHKDPKDLLVLLVRKGLQVPQGHKGLRVKQDPQGLKALQDKRDRPDHRVLKVHKE